VKQLQARQESKDLSKVTLRGQLSSLKARSYLGGVPPYGYDYLYTDSAGKPLQVVRYNERGEKLVLHAETGDLTRVVPQGEPRTGSKADRIRLVPSSPTAWRSSGASSTTTSPATATAPSPAA